MTVDRRSGDRDTVLYRLEIGGPIAESWARWFETDTIEPCGRNTLLEVRVADQSELYGRLRRIHDLNLRLISLTLAGNSDDRVEKGSKHHRKHSCGESE